ncbi:MAG: hypothetical protein JSV88_19645 [Candidatus Aminicenantes bacterium]|nr:MAG: hypothetical protein JSV88_19645 [Candidatus Aminicenantes bacterium]
MDIIVNPGNVGEWGDRLAHKEKGQKLIPIEIKFSDVIKSRALKPIQLFMKQNKLEKGIIITRNREEEVKIENSRLRFIPAWLFALKKEIKFLIFL